MAFKGFGRESGPAAPPKSQPLFGPPPVSPPIPIDDNPHSSRTIRVYRDLDALKEDAPSPFTSVQSTMRFTHSSEMLDRDSIFKEYGQKGLADREFSKQTHKMPSPVGTIYTQPRPELLISHNQDPHQLQSPSISYADAVRGPSVTLPRPVPKKKVLRITDFPSQPVQSSLGNGANSENAVNKNPSHAVPKRTRSPPQPSSESFLGTSYSNEDGVEREIEAKAKRLARFKTDLSVPAQNIFSVTPKNDHPKFENQKDVGDYGQLTENVQGDVCNEGPHPSNVIVGVCSDMCPESEREERERKGDLDQYERLDGDRNQSSKGLAVKKYTRTAEREANLIRPLPILQKTMEYLLNLLDQPYGDSFLGLYNFLWDRMRAVRMDLRMQHIFNLESITMLEQMIRLHIIAMHELCEYTKGEGFSEGFDAHLNIEQMNKASVELFQMYDDYRKKGVYVPTEKEFRGYYALLKLDKHPGYKVEPAELSLDLAKMTPEIRQTQEVLLARNVARSCRTGNFIAFFRLATKASYLQACLMHAHFSKLRTQALASLHSGLQNNQGIPVAHVAKWLGLESEDAEELLEYHGFSIKEFDGLYMVKDGPFLNVDKDFPTRCSQLVHLKKSKHVIEDVLSSPQMTINPSQAAKAYKPMRVNRDNPVVAQSLQRGRTFIAAAKEESDVKSSPSPKKGIPLQHQLKGVRNLLSDQDDHPSFLASSPKDRMQVEPAPSMKQDQHNIADKNQYTEQISQPWNFATPKFFSDTQTHVEKKLEQTHKLPLVPPQKNVPSSLQQMPLTIMTSSAEQENSASNKIIIANSMQHVMAVEKPKDDEGAAEHDFHEEEVVEHSYDEEVAKAKLKLIMRLWRRRCATKREIREQNLLATNAALNSLSVGLPIQPKQERRLSYRRFNIDEMTNKRYKKHEESWSGFSVIDLVADILCQRNPSSSCISWKVALCGLNNQVSHSSADQWLHSKLMPSTTDVYSDDLIISSPGLAIWKKWVTEHSQTSCCLSIIKAVTFSNMNEDLAGCNGVVFLLSEATEIESQKLQLQNSLTSLPYGSCTPLLILSSSSEEDSTIADKLGLHELDNSRISCYLIAHYHEKLDGYFSDKNLKEGLKWLASKSLPQPVLWTIQTRELVMSHLNKSLDTLNKADPNQCISAFNDALDKSVEDIVAAVNANPSGWPCPELSLLHNANDFNILKSLPSIGWSSSETVEPLLSVLRHCKLPVMLDDVSFLNRAAVSGDELQEQKLHLQDCLISYLNQSSKMMNLTMAMREANIMLQKSTRLEVHSTGGYYVVPNWVLIFRRVFNWRLNVLSCYKAYVLEKRSPSEQPQESDVSSYIDQPSLDEMIGVSLKSSPAPVRQESRDDKMNGAMAAIRAVQDYNDVPLGSEITKESTRDLVLSVRQEDRLTQLLEQCNMVQNKIGEKLSIYF